MQARLGATFDTGTGHGLKAKRIVISTSATCVASVAACLAGATYDIFLIPLRQDAIGRASVMHGDTAACHFDGIVRVLCLSERLRHHIKLENNPTTLAARQAAIAAATALAECAVCAIPAPPFIPISAALVHLALQCKKGLFYCPSAGLAITALTKSLLPEHYGKIGSWQLRLLQHHSCKNPRANPAALHHAVCLCHCRKKRRSKMAAAARDGSIVRTTSMDRVTSYGSFGGHSLDRTTSFGSAGDSGSPRSSSSFEVHAPHETHSPVSPSTNCSVELCCQSAADAVDVSHMKSTLPQGVPCEGRRPACGHAWSRRMV